MYAEILLTRLALGYTSQGGGFSHYQAGVSHGGAKSLDGDYWEAIQQKIFGSEFFVDNLKGEMAKMNTVAEQFESSKEVATIQFRDSVLGVKALRQILGA